MDDKQPVIEKIRAAFGRNEFPGENFLQGSFEGSEPEQEVGPFRSLQDWTTIEADFLDAHAAALSFFTEAGFRFFLPAYLIADLNDLLRVADPVFHLTHGFFDFSVEAPAGGRIFVINSGMSVLINPRRYGAATFGDFARYRMSIFTREEADAIAAYLQFKRDHDPDHIDESRLNAALESFWLERARSAPPAEDLQRHLADQQEYLAALRSGPQGGSEPHESGSTRDAK